MKRKILVSIAFLLLALSWVGFNILEAFAPFDITLSGNTITAIGGSYGSEMSAEDLYNADKAGEYTLVQRGPMSGTDGADYVPVNASMRPGDMLALGLEQNDLWVSCYDWDIGVSEVRISINGTEKDGTVQSQLFYFTSEGQTNAGYYFSSLMGTKVTYFSGVSGHNYTYSVTQGQWGLIWKNQDPGNITYSYDCKLKFGNGTSQGETFFKETSATMVFNDGVIESAYEKHIELTAYSHFYLGELRDEDNYVTNDGVTLISKETTYTHYLFMGWSGGNSTAHLFSSNFVHTSNQISRVGLGNGSRVFNCNFDGTCLYQHMSITNSQTEVYRVNLMGHGSGSGYYNPRGTINDVIIANYTYGLEIIGINSPEVTVENIRMYNISSKEIYQSGTQTNDLFLLNFESDNFRITWGTSSTGYIWRNYEFDCHVQDAATGIENANVTALYADEYISGSTSEEHFIDGYEEVTREWSEFGASPWLDATGDSKYIAAQYSKTHDEFTFEDSTAYFDATIEVYARRQGFGTGKFNIWLWDGSSWSDLGLVTTSITWIWYTKDASSHLNSLEEINSARLRVVSSNIGSCVVEIDAAKLTGTSYTYDDQAFSVLTDGSGDISTQQVSEGYYTLATGDTKQDLNPINLTITESSYDTYTLNFSIDSKTDWTIRLPDIAVESTVLNPAYYLLGGITLLPICLLLAIVWLRRRKNKPWT